MVIPRDKYTRSFSLVFCQFEVRIEATLLDIAFSGIDFLHIVLASGSRLGQLFAMWEPSPT